MATEISNLSKVISPGFNENVLLDILKKKSGCSDPKVREIKLGSASKKGDSYLSTVTRFTVEGTGDDGSGDSKNFEVHIIVKSIPYSIVRVKSFRSPDFFGTEIAFYNKAWPLFQAFLKSRSLNNWYTSIPLCLATYSDGRNDFIAMEDVSYQGYKPLERASSGLDAETTVFILKNFAKFHALGVAYREQHPKEFGTIEESLKETYFDEKFRDWYKGSMEKFCRVIKDAAAKELPAEYLKKVEGLMAQDLFGNICKLLKERPTLTAVTHGDCWPPNFLIQEVNSSRNLMLIDFQLSRAASLTTDILFLLYTCVDPAVLQGQWDSILKTYHASLVQALKDLGSKLDISFETFMKELKSYGLFAFGMCNEALIMSLMDDDDVADLDALEGDEQIPLHTIWKIEPIKDGQKRQRVADYIKHILDHIFI